MPFTDTDDAPAIRLFGFRVCDTSVLLINFLLVLCLLFFSLFQAFAETVQDSGNTTLTTSLVPKNDYTELLAPIFSEVGRPIPEDANDFVKDLVAYRFLVLRALEENGQILAPLVTLAEQLPTPFREEYRRQIASVSLAVADQRTALFPYFDGDLFLRSAVITTFNAYPSFLDRLFLRLEGALTVEGLRSIRETTTIIRRDIALLYSRIQREHCLQQASTPSSCSGR